MMFNLLCVCLGYGFMLIQSLLMGDLLLKKTSLSENRWGMISVGFFATVAVFQILMYPAQLFHFSTVLQIVCLGFVVLLTVFFERKRFFTVINSSIKELFVVSVFAGAAALLAIFYYDSFGRTTLADNWFYLRFVRANAQRDALVNMYNPSSSSFSPVKNIYSFSGLYHLYSGLVMMFKTDALFFTLWFGTLMQHAITAATYCFILSWWHPKKIWTWLIVLTGLITAYTDLGLEYGYLASYFRTASGASVVLLLFLLKYYEKKDRNYLNLYLIFTVALMSAQSTQFFISVFLTFIMCVYEIIVYKNRNVHYFTMLALPCLIYAVAMLIYEGSIISAVLMAAGFAVLNVLYALLKHTRIYPVLVMLILAGMLIGINASALFPLDFKMTIQESFDYFSGQFVITKIPSSFSQMSSVLAKLLKLSLVVVSSFALLNWKKLDHEVRFVSVAVLILVLYFYNPLVAPAVRTYLTGNVYSRIENLYYSPVFVVVLMRWVSKSKVAGVVSLCSLALVTSSVIRISNESTHILSRIESIQDAGLQKLMYRVEPELMDMGRFLNQYSQGELTILYPKYINSFLLVADRVAGSELMPTFSQMRNDEEIDYSDLSLNIERNQIQAMLYRPEYYFTDYYYQFDSERVPDLRSLILQSDVDVFVMSVWQGDQTHVAFDQMLESFAVKIYSNGFYEMYQVIR